MIRALLLVATLGATFTYCVEYTAGPIYSGSSFADPSEWTWRTDPVDSAIFANPNTQGVFSSATLGPNYYEATFSSVSYNSSARYSYSLRSTRTINPNTLIMMQVSHMPDFCGTWPSFWLYSENSDAYGWPSGGEIDIVEGVNGVSSNRATLHTLPGCSITTPSTDFAGTFLDRNCRSNSSNDEGCTISASNLNTFGSDFNYNNGGWIALEWTAQSSTNSGTISMWYIPASAGYTWQDTVDPSTFPASASKYAQFDLASGNCPASLFANMNIVLQLRICGDWVSQTWVSSGCAASTGAGSCEQWISAINGDDQTISVDVISGDDYTWEQGFQFSINSITVYTP